MVMEALAASVPILFVPCYGEHHYIGHAVARAGCGVVCDLESVDHLFVRDAIDRHLHADAKHLCLS